MPVAEGTQIYENYDRAFVDWVHSLKHRSHRLPCVFATPDRAFAQMARVLTKRGGVETSIDNVPIPFGSIQRVSEAYDPQRFVQHYEDRVARSKDGTRWFGMTRPLPYNFLYQVSLWGRTLRQLDDLFVQLTLRLRADEFYLEVDHPDIPFWNLEETTQLIVLTLYRGSQSTSELEPGRDKPVQRRVLSYLVHGWICYPADEYGIVETIRTRFYDQEEPPADEENLIGAVDVSWAD